MKNSHTPILDRDSRVYAGQVGLLYSHALIGISASLLNGLIMIVVLWNFIPRIFLVSWGFMILAISIARTAGWMRYRNADDRVENARKWGRLFITGMAFTGLAWGASAFWIAYSHEMAIHLLIAFVVGGMVAGASSALSALRAAFYAFSIPAMVPLNIAFFTFSNLIYISMAIMMLLFLFFLSMVAQGMYGVILRSFQLRHEKDDLIGSLEESKRETESALLTLHQEVKKRLETESELRILSENLERQVHERTRELEYANRELNSFAYSVSHDLRAPVRAIDGFSRMLKQDFGGVLGEKGEYYLNTVQQSVDRMNELIDDVLSLSRVSQQDLDLQVCDLSGLAREIAGELQKSEPDRQAEFSIAEDLTIWCDGRLIRIALENLIANSWKFTRNSAPAKIQFGRLKKNGLKIFFVADNGVGFEMAYADKLFTPFQRLHSEREFEGTGIGLATVQRIIHRHGGSIWAESEVGKGATFFFTLKERD